MKSAINRRIFTVLIILLITGFFVCQSNQLFALTTSRDFEGGAVGSLAKGASGFDYAGTLTTFSSDRAMSGTGSAKMAWQKGNEGFAADHGNISMPNVTNGGEFWARGYFYFASPWSWISNTGTYSVIKVLRGVSDSGGMPSIFSDSNGSIVLSNEPASRQFITKSSLDIGKWVCLEMYVKVSSSSSGIIRIWKDGVMVAEDIGYKTIALSNNYINSIQVMSNWNNAPSQNQTQYIDEFVVTTDTPSNVDSLGNPMIGPINWAASSPPPPSSTTPSDTTPPVISGVLPSGTLAFGTTATNLTVTTNENATCKYGTSDVAYSSMPNIFSTTGGTSHSQTLSGLISGGSYTYYVRCMDGSNNADTTSTTITFNVSSTAANLLLSESFESSTFATSNGWYDSTTQGTIVSGGQSGNCLQWTWTQGKTLPNNVGGMTRRKFTPTEKMYVSFYVKFQTGWQGSQMLYHPHVLSVLSNLDADWAAPSDSYLNTYIEFISDIGSPYTIRPQLKLQDTLRTNKSYGVNGTPLNSSGTPVNISALTENRSVNTCNGYKSGSDSGVGHDCYDEGGGVWYSATNWSASNASVTTNAWHHVETYFQMNSISGGIGQADGVMQMWIDGAPVIDKSNIVYRTGYGTDATKKWAQFDLQAYIGSPGSPITQTMWLDELKVYDGLPSNLAKPTAPTGLKAIGVTP